MPQSQATLLPYLSLILVGCVACNTAHPHQALRAATKPEWVAGAVPVAAFVSEQRLLRPAARTLVYVGAHWCEPCERFHAALQAGQLDAALPGVRFIAYDLDAARAALDADGYRARLIPMFVVPAEDGRAGPRRIEGSIKGEGAVDQIMPRLKELLAPP